MSKLYMKATSDARRAPIKARGHKAINVDLFYGSRGESRLAGSMRISLTDGKFVISYWNEKSACITNKELPFEA